MRNIKYLLNGLAVEVIQEVPNGFLVANAYDVSEDEQGDECEPIFDDSSPYFVKAVYDKAPTQKQDDAIKQLEIAIAQYTADRNAIQKEVWDMRSEKEKTAKTLHLHNDPAINALVNVLDGTFTHFVFSEYGRINIVSAEEIRKDDYSYEISLTFKIGQKKAEWRMYTRRDHHTNYPLFPCNSYEDAIKRATEIIVDGFKDEKMNWAEYYIGSAKKFNIEIPTEYLEKHKANKIQIAANAVSVRLKDLKKAQEEYNKLLEI